MKSYPKLAIAAAISFLLTACTLFGGRDARTIFNELMPNQQATAVEPLLAGKSDSELYKITSQDGHYVLRVLVDFGPRAIRNEFLLSQRAAELDIAPKVYAVSSEQAALVMEHIPGGELFYRKATPAQMQQLAQKLRRMHLNIDPSIKRPRSPARLVQQAYNEVAKLIPPRYQTALDTVLPMLEAIGETSTFTIIHGDVHPWNILVRDKDIYLIDWTDARSSHPLLDVAATHMFLGGDKASWEHFVRSYFGREPTTQELQQLQLAYRARCLIVAFGAFKEAYKDGARLPVDPEIAEQTRYRLAVYDWEALEDAMRRDARVTLALSEIFLEDALNPQLYNAL